MVSSAQLIMETQEASSPTKATEPFLSAPVRLTRRSQLVRRQLLTQIYYEVRADISLELVPASIYEMASDLEIDAQETEAAIFMPAIRGI